MNALQYKESKFWLVPDVPEKPCLDGCESESYCFDNCYKEYRYDKELKQALSNSIEVAEECVELANRIIISEGHQVMLDAEFNNAGVVLLEYRATHRASVKDGNEKWTVMVKRLTPIEGELYPIEGLTYELDTCGKPCNECIEKAGYCVQQVAILSLDSTKEYNTKEYNNQPK